MFHGIAYLCKQELALHDHYEGLIVITLTKLSESDIFLCALQTLKNIVKKNHICVCNSNECCKRNKQVQVLFYKSRRFYIVQKSHCNIIIRYVSSRGKILQSGMPKHWLILLKRCSEYFDCKSKLIGQIILYIASQTVDFVTRCQKGY